MVENLGKAIEAIYDAALDPVRWPTALQMAANSLESVGANLFWQRDDGAYGLIVSPGIPTKCYEEYEAYWWQYDLRAHRAIERGYVTNGSAQTDRHLITDEELDTLPYFAEFNASYGLKWLAGMGVSPDPHVLIALVVQRSPHQPRFSDEDLAQLERLGRHVELAMRLSTRLFNADLIRDSLAAVLTRLDIGVLLLDDTGKIAFANKSVANLFGQSACQIGDYPHFQNNEVQSKIKSSVDRLLQAGPKSELDASVPLLVPTSIPQDRCVLYTMPAGSLADAAGSFLSDIKVVILAIGFEDGAPADPSIVRDLFGLTFSEARLAALIAAGLSPRQASEKLGISEETARTALKRVFSKVGVNKQSELAVLLARITLR